MSKVTDRLIKNFLEAEYRTPIDEILKVNAVIGKAAFVYEKVRNAIDYQEEHLIRKSAIYRILKRKLLLEKVILENYLLDKYHHENLPKQLLQELIRGGYIRDKVPVQMVKVVDDIIQKYNVLLAKIKESEGKLTRKQWKYFLEMCSVEIELAVIPPKKEKALINAMFSVYNPRIKFKNQDITDQEKELQAYLCCHRVLFKWDEAMLRTLLLGLYYPQWKKADEATIGKIANNIGKIVAEIDKQIAHPLKNQVQKVLQKKAIIFWIIQDILESEPKKAKQIFGDAELLEEEIKKQVHKRYKGVRVKLRRGVVRSIIYVFFTKMVLALALEFPMDWYLNGAINYVSVAINILFPPFLMFVVAILIRMPKKENTTKIVNEISQIALKQNEGKMYELKPFHGRSKISRYIFNLIYGLTFLFSIMMIFTVLYKWGFNFFSSLIFVLFLTLVSFFGMRIRRPVQDLLAVERRESIIGSIVDFFALPFVSMGRWMSGKFSKINVLAMFLDLIIEAPFKLLIEVFEDLFGFIREKKEEVMDD